MVENRGIMGRVVREIPAVAQARAGLGFGRVTQADVMSAGRIHTGHQFDINRIL